MARTAASARSVASGGEHLAIHGAGAAGVAGQGRGATPASVGDGAAGAEQAHAGAADFVADAVNALERFEQIDDVIDHGLVAIGRETLVAEAFGQRDDADGQAVVADQLRRAVAVQADPGELGAAAADIEQQGAAAGAGQQGGAAFQRELGFLTGGDHVDRQAGFGADAGQEFGAVGGAAGRLRWRWRARRGPGRRCQAGRRRRAGPGARGPSPCSGELAGMVQALRRGGRCGRSYPATRKPPLDGGADQKAAIIGAQIEVPRTPDGPPIVAVRRGRRRGRTGPSARLGSRFGGSVNSLPRKGGKFYVG